MPQAPHEPDFAGGIADFAADVISLAELQIQLLVVDINECRSRFMLGISLLVIAPMTCLAALPILLLSASTVLAGSVEISVECAQAIVALTTLMIAGVIGWVGWRQFNSSLNILSRSRSELKQNLAWIKSALKTQRHPPGFRSPFSSQHGTRY